MALLYNLVWLLIAFLLGSIPTGYLIGKRVKGIDVREHGSGNVGATNVFRTVGKGWGLLVLAADALKGWAAVTVIALTVDAFPEMGIQLKQILFGSAAVAGHIWTPWLKLKGGKGVATAAGALSGIFPTAAAACFLIWALVFTLSRYVSLSSMVAALLFPLSLLALYPHMDQFESIFILSAILALMLIYNHRGNIKRLREGKELKIQLGKSTSGPDKPR